MKAHPSTEAPCRSDPVSRRRSSERASRSACRRSTSSWRPGRSVSAGPTRSRLGVPIKAAERVIGVVSLESVEAYAYSEAAAPVHARFEHGCGARECTALRPNEAAPGRDRRTRRRTCGHQRDRDSTGQPVGVRGDRPGRWRADRSLFAASSIYIAILDPTSKHFSFPYAINEGVRQTDAAPMPLGRGLTSMVIERRGPVRFGTLAEQQRHDLVDEGPRSESWLGADPRRDGRRRARRRVDDATCL